MLSHSSNSQYDCTEATYILYLLHKLLQLFSKFRVQLIRDEMTFILIFQVRIQLISITIRGTGRKKELGGITGLEKQSNNFSKRVIMVMFYIV